jgi:hypothetical protein
MKKSDIESADLEQKLAFGAGLVKLYFRAGHG